MTTPPKGQRNPYRSIAVAAIGITLFIGIPSLTLLLYWYGAEFEQGSGSNSETNSSGLSPEHVTLFYVSEDGMGLAGHQSEIEPGPDASALARAIVSKQLANAPDPFRSPFPNGTRMRSLFLSEDGNAFVDLSREITDNHSGGSLDELFTVYSLVNALAINVPAISAVQIMVESQEVDTLAGHIDLRQPLEPNTKWVLPPGDLQTSSDQSEP